MECEPTSETRRGERVFALLLLCTLLGFAGWSVSVGWRSHALPGNSFRQTQTAITAMFVQREHNFSLAYPTPVLGKPWSVPFEFPLYQWTVVVVSDTTGLSLLKCGRLVSAVCFFLGLPALWLLLGRMGVPWVRRVVALGMVLTCPLLVFYARAFLIETMALMFSLWFLQAYVAAVEKRSYLWLAVANLAGIGAGLVKVTTFMVYLVPAALWALWWVWGEWRRRNTDAGPNVWAGIARLAAWVAATTVVPFSATYAWLIYSDLTKALNPGARNLVSSSMHGYNFGNWTYRSDPAIWSAQWRTFSVEILPPTTLLVVAGVLFLSGRGRVLRWAAGCAGLFLLAPATFPVLYAWHEYYFTAVAVLPMLAIGLALGSLLEIGHSRWRAWAAVGVVFGMQAHTYLSFHRPQQLLEGHGAIELTEALRFTTNPDDVLVIAGEDWSSNTPFYAKRRALMLRRDMESDGAYVQESFANLKGESVSVLLLRGAQRENGRLLEVATAAFGISPEPVYRWGDAVVYMAKDRVPLARAKIAQMGLEKVELCGSATPVPEGPILWEYEFMPPKLRSAFAPLGLVPLRCEAQFGISAAQSAGRECTGAHPTTRIWFSVAPGRHQLTVEFTIDAGAYAGLRREDATDGVEFVVAAVRGSDRRRVLYSRLLNPFDELEDRGWQRERVQIDLAAGEELMLETLSGPANNLRRDWASWGRLDIK